MAMKKISIIFISLYVSAHCFAVEQIHISPSFDCSQAKGYVEKTICSNESLSIKDSMLSNAYNLYKKVTGKYGLAPENSQKQWLKKRNLCKDHECLNILYLSRINELMKYVQLNEVSYSRCPPGEACILVDRRLLGYYHGKRVMLDTIESNGRHTYALYEQKDNNKEHFFGWDGSFKDSRTKLDRSHYSPKPKNQDLVKVQFGTDKKGCPDCYRITDVIERTEKGWIHKKL